MKSYRQHLNELKKFGNCPPITKISETVNADVTEHIKKKTTEAENSEAEFDRNQATALAYASAVGALTANYSHAIEKIAELLEYIENQPVNV